MKNFLLAATSALTLASFALTTHAAWPVWYVPTDDCAPMEQVLKLRGFAPTVHDPYQLMHTMDFDRITSRFPEIIHNFDDRDVMVIGGVSSTYPWIILARTMELVEQHKNW
jgi:hypothetical protein